MSKKTSLVLWIIEMQKKNKSRQRHIRNQKTCVRFSRPAHDNVFVSPPKLFILATTPNTIEIYATFDPPIREALLIF